MKILENKELLRSYIYYICKLGEDDTDGDNIDPFVDILVTKENGKYVVYDTVTTTTFGLKGKTMMRLNTAETRQRNWDYIDLFIDNI